MTSTQLERVKEFLDKALERPAGERAAFVSVSCPDTEVRTEVLRLLAAHQQAEKEGLSGKGGFMEAVTAPTDANPGAQQGPDPAPKRTLLSTAPPPDAMPDRVDRYRILRPIQRGGMGSVYLAVRDDDQLKTHVALKVVRRGMDTDDILHRFKQERQLLAALGHPNIARVMDAGMTEDGRPYFVMEYVKGEPIDAYCDTQQLSIDERLELFKKVCSAVHFAHQNLIIHRDLKPLNILVGEDGEPKLLDFGIAKVINPAIAGATLVTDPQRRLMTPEYASPEQVTGKGLTIATDVYSLGVVLYELLTGHSPYHVTRTAEKELVRLITEVDPEKPSLRVTHDETVDLGGGTTRLVTPVDVARTRDTRPQHLRRKLSGDLDNIILKSMRKLPRRRYQSAEQFAEDIERHLDGMPVTARADTVWYRTAKFVRRNRAGVAAALLIFIALVGGVAATTWQWRRAEEALTQTRLAQEQTQAALTAARFAQAQTQEATERADLWSETVLNDLLQDPDLSARARERLLNRVPTLDTASASDPGRLRDAARTHVALGKVYGLGGPNLAKPVETVDHLSKAVDLYAKVISLKPDSVESKRDYISTLCLLGRAQEANHAPGAEATLTKAAERARALAQAYPDDPASTSLDVACRKQLADLYVKSGRRDEALTLYLEVERRRDDLVKHDPANLQYIRDRSVVRVDLGGYFAGESGRPINFERAESFYKLALSDRLDLLRGATADNGYPKTTAKRDVMMSYYSLGNLHYRAEHPAEADDALSHALSLARELVEADPSDVRVLMNLVMVCRDMGRNDLFNKSNPVSKADAASAYEHYKDCVVYATRLVEAAPNEPEHKQLLASAWYERAQAAGGNGEYEEAERSVKEAVAILEKIAAGASKNASVTQLSRDAKKYLKTVTDEMEQDGTNTKK